jgi:RecG-like helicase
MLLNCELDAHYRTDDKDPITSFYLPCLRESIVYKRAVGYFRSSVFTLVAEDFLSFALKGGKYLLICSPELDEKDFNALANNISQQDQLIAKSLVSEITWLLQNESAQDNLRVLSTLVKFGVMEIKLAVRPSNQGLYHEKIGIFVDEFSNKVSFVGSANESWSGWHSSGNFESIEVFCSWHHTHDKERCDRHELNFDKLWHGHTNGIRSLSFPEAAKELLITKSFNSLEEAKELIKKAGNSKSSAKQNTSKNRTLLPHQSQAIEAWLSNNSNGILEHATGSGKTFTGLMAAKSHVIKGLPVLVLVPSKLLFKQWEEDIFDLYPDASVYVRR